MASDNKQGPHKISPRKAEYLEKFKDPRWQKLRLQVFERDEFSCQICFDDASTLHVHHRYYESGKEPWGYPLEALVTLCEGCHEEETENRYGEERALLRALRNHFFSADINSLARGFMFMQLTRIPDVVAGAIEWALLTPEIQREIVDRHLDYLVKKHKIEIKE